MATKSILKTINIKDNKTARSFIDAVEKAKSYKSVQYTKKCTENMENKIKEFFNF